MAKDDDKKGSATAEPEKSKHQLIHERAKQLPEGWELHFANEESALAAYDSMAPASVAGLTKMDADGPSAHLLMNTDPKAAKEKAADPEQ